MVEEHKYGRIVTDVQWENAKDKVNFIENIGYDAIADALEKGDKDIGSIQDIKIDIQNNYDEGLENTKLVTVIVYYESVV